MLIFATLEIHRIFLMCLLIDHKWVIIHRGWWILFLALGLMSLFLNVGVYESFVKDKKTTFVL
jgi:hypothetical protein